MSTKIVLSIFICLIISACGEVEKTSSTKEEVFNKKEDIINRSKEWNKAINQQNIKSLTSYYHDKIFIYGQEKSQKVIQDKASYFQSHPSYKQSIEKITVDSIDNGRYKSSFSKSYSISGGKTKTVQAYLIFVQDGEQWLIKTESDLTTDKNIAKRAERWELDREVIAMGVLSVERATIPSGTYDFYILELPSPHKIHYPKDEEAEYLEYNEGSAAPICDQIQVAQLDTASTYESRAYWKSLVGRTIRAKGEIFIGFNHNYRTAYGMAIDDPKKATEIVE